jgi:alpha/beta superfamily hydrolase
MGPPQTNRHSPLPGRLFEIVDLNIAGTKDTLASPERVGEIFEVANEPKQYLEFDTDHFYKRDADMLNQINRAIALFFNKNLL